MSSKTETGHSKNVANLTTLIVTLQGFGGRYNPAKESIKLSALVATEEASREAINSINEHRPVYTRALAERDTAMKPVGKLARRVVNALKTTDAPQKTIDAAKSLCDKINGTKRRHEKPETDKEETENGNKTPRGISTAQTSFDGKAENFSRLVILLAATPEYKPNEEELKTETLNALCEQLGSLNLTAITAAQKMNNLRIERDRVLYGENTGLFAAVTDVKTYLRSIFDVNSSEYKQITALRFINKRK